MLWCVETLLLCQPAPAIVVENHAPVSRDEIVRVSLPLPNGRYKSLEGFVVAGRWAPAVPLIRWPDGTLAVVQLHARVSIAAATRRRIVIDPTEAAAPAGKLAESGEVAKSSQRPPRWCLPADLPIRVELTDPWGAVYEAPLRADDSELVDASDLVRVRRYRTVFRRRARSFFGLSAYLTTFAGRRDAELTVSVENGVREPNVVIGPARFKSLALVITDPHLKIRPRFIRENQLRAPTHAEGGWRQVLLRPSDHWYLGDRTAKTWRFDLFQDGAGVSDAERATAARAVEAPLVALPDLDWTRYTRAFGAHGGLAPGPGRPTLASAYLVQQWRGGTDFGPFGGFGDPRDATANGTPRNGPCALHNVLRFGDGKLLRAAEGMVLQSCLRPSPGALVRVPAAAAALRQGLSKRTMQMPHGWTALDYEHFSVDLVYDYFWLTGDPLARDELRRLGVGLRRVIAGVPFATCRGEGWCMQAAVLIARATGDTDLISGLDRRFKQEIQPALGGVGATFVLRQPPHRDSFVGREPFDCPWQMSAFVHGAAAMAVQTGDPAYRNAALRAAHVMAGPGWVRGLGPKFLVSATGSGRYTMPVGYGPLEGTALMQVGGFVLAETMAVEEHDKSLFRKRARQLFAPHEKASRQRTAMNVWFQLLLDREERRR